MVQFASYLRGALCKTCLIFPRINGSNVSARRIKLEIRKSQDLANDLTLAKKTKCLGPTYKMICAVFCDLLMQRN